MEEVREMTFEELAEDIVGWQTSQDTIGDKDIEKQMIKIIQNIFEFNNKLISFIEEFNLTDFDMIEAELDDYGSYLYELNEEVKTKMGEILANIFILCKQNDIKPRDCLWVLCRHKEEIEHKWKADIEQKTRKINHEKSNYCIFENSSKGGKYGF